MARKPNLKEIKILIADNDANLGIVLTNVLQRMGFKHVQFVRDGEAAKQALEKEHKDILITEWQMQSVDGIELTGYIRNSGDSSMRLLPIIMLTARAEKQDVEAARDAGITEFVVKPYNSLTVFRRIQQVIDNPRAFLMAPQYIGPDRRRRDAEILTFPDRRIDAPEVISSPEETVSGQETPKLIPPDYVLKKRIGLVDTLDSIITPHLLAEAQKVIDDLKDEALGWIKRYVNELEHGYKQLVKHPTDADVELFKKSLLDLKSNTGTFGYAAASELAQKLYQFVRFDFAMGDSRHLHVLLKHVQSLKLLLSSHAEGKMLDKERLLLDELRVMMSRFQKNTPMSA